LGSRGKGGAPPPSSREQRAMSVIELVSRELEALLRMRRAISESEGESSCVFVSADDDAELETDRRHRNGWDKNPELPDCVEHYPWRQGMLSASDIRKLTETLRLRRARTDMAAELEQEDDAATSSLSEDSVTPSSRRGKAPLLHAATAPALPSRSLSPPCPPAPSRPKRGAFRSPPCDNVRDELRSKLRVRRAKIDAECEAALTAARNMDGEGGDASRPETPKKASLQQSESLQLKLEQLMQTRARTPLKDILWSELEPPLTPETDLPSSPEPEPATSYSEAPMGSPSLARRLHEELEAVPEQPLFAPAWEPDPGPTPAATPEDGVTPSAEAVSSARAAMAEILAEADTIRASGMEITSFNVQKLEKQVKILSLEERVKLRAYFLWLDGKGTGSAITDYFEAMRLELAEYAAA